MDAFPALIHSLGEHAVAYLKRDLKLSQLSVFGDEVTGTAHIEVVLPHPTWADHSAAIDHMIELRSIFVDEISFDYVVLTEDECGDLTGGRSRDADFVAA